MAGCEGWFSDDPHGGLTFFLPCLYFALTFFLLLLMQIPGLADGRRCGSTLSVLASAASWQGGIVLPQRARFAYLPISLSAILFYTARDTEIQSGRWHLCVMNWILGVSDGEHGRTCDHRQGKWERGGGRRERLMYYWHM
jgi:hypothetical protein